MKDSETSSKLAEPSKAELQSRERIEAAASPIEAHMHELPDDGKTEAERRFEREQLKRVSCLQPQACDVTSRLTMRAHHLCSWPGGQRKKRIEATRCVLAIASRSLQDCPHLTLITIIQDRVAEFNAKLESLSEHQCVLFRFGPKVCHKPPLDLRDSHFLLFSSLSHLAAIFPR